MLAALLLLRSESARMCGKIRAREGAGNAWAIPLETIIVTGE